MNLRELMALKDRVDGAIANLTAPVIDEYDVVLDYSVTLKSSDGVISKNRGSMQLNKLLHPRLITTAPGRVEQVCRQHVLTPLNADLFDKLDSASPQPDRSLHAIQQHNYGDSTATTGLQLPPLEF